MFGSNLLDVTIGMIFIYLLLSLICSAANEIIEGWLKNRATDLERGIRELLDPNSEVNQTGIVARLYDHPLVNGLYKGRYGQFARYKNRYLLWRWLFRLFNGPKLPSYIPARNFALALMDAVLPASSAHIPAAAGAAAPPDRASGAAGATPATPPAAPVVVVTAIAPAAPAAAAPNLQRLRDAIGETTDVQTRRALLALVDAAGNDVNKARENIENWFNSSMDRVSGWYKRRSQVIILVLGLGVAVALNADTVILVKRLSTDKTMRDSLVAAAEAYAKTNPSNTSSGTSETIAASTKSATGAAKPLASPPPKKSPSLSRSPSSGSVTPALPADSSTSSAAKAKSSASPSPKASPSLSPSQSLSSSSSAVALPPECARDKNSPECKIELNLAAIKKLSLPIGWDSGDDPHLKWPGNKWITEGGWWDQLCWHWLGWLITALAVSLGAPFWFDLLNKFVVVRSTVKPQEKSPQEGSKQ